MWDAALQPLLRARLPALPQLPADARAGEATALCGLANGAAVVAADGTRTRLAIDPATGPRRCAAYWPQAGGWHRLTMGEASHPFHVLAPDAAPAMRLTRLRKQTQDLQAGSDGQRTAGGAADAPQTGGPAAGGCSACGCFSAVSCGGSSARGSDAADQRSEKASPSRSAGNRARCSSSGTACRVVVVTTSSSVASLSGWPRKSTAALSPL